MPIYEYKCQQCGAHVEKRQSVSDAPLITCEKCHGKLEKQWSLSGFQFKGAGWYVTDYAGKNSGPSEKTSSSESTAGGEAASKPKDDAKPAAKDTKTTKE
ncbi:MAG TPA: FmdB family zinc ribbon protein [Pyrinomonadaceae bacterium]|jgi:putative FmdB family regulatory protein|nr:FmdB family zinc ribbon protein [Pyrinomonadaceae bacterium]